MAEQEPDGRGSTESELFTGDGEMSGLMRAHDWAATPVGPVAGWPRSLQIVVRLLLDSRYAMWLGWGSHFTFFYNDAYARMTLAAKHPWALGRSAREVWAEIWHDIGPRAESVVRTGTATWDERLLLFLERRGFPEETYHTFSYSPVLDDRGGVGGMLCVVTEDTERVIGERRLRTLRELAARTTEEAKSAEEACRAAAGTLAANPYDLPFALLYLIDADARTARLAGSTGLPPDSPAAPAAVDLAAPAGQEPCWPLRGVLETGRPEVALGVRHWLGAGPVGPWPELPHTAVVLPVRKSGQDRLAGFLVAGVSPRRPFDDDYRGFLDLLAGQIASAVANARAYEEERRRAEALAELDRAKTAFFSNVSHEFRTPLTLMLGPVEDLLARPDERLPAEDREHLEVVQRNGQRLQKLVNTLLDFSRIEAGRVQASYEPTDLGAFTAELASCFRSACQRAGLDLAVDCPPVGEPVWVDREMWEKVVLNLLSNAFKYTLHGRIEVSLRPLTPDPSPPEGRGEEEKGPLTPDPSPPQGRGEEEDLAPSPLGGEGLGVRGRCVELAVRDTGVGIPPEQVPHLFERFHRVEGSRGRTQEGSGIGLALVKELVRLHGGEVSAESRLDEGSTFRVTLPLGSAHLPPERIKSPRTLASTALGAAPSVEEALRWLPSEADKETSRQGDKETEEESPPFRPVSLSPCLPVSLSSPRPRILLADDNADMREYITRLLASRYEVAAVANGLAARDAARRQPPDLVLSDVMMPGLDGFGLLRELRGQPETADVPVLLLSARAGEEASVEGLRAGADDYLTKPFSARELLARVQAHLDLARLRREAAAALRHSEERFRQLADAMPQIVFTARPDGRADYLNRRWYEYSGQPNGEVSEEGWLSVLHPDDRAACLAEAERTNRAGIPFEMELRLREGRSGQYRWHLARSVPVRDGGGRVVRWYGTSTNIHERKRAEDASRFLADASATLAAVVDYESTLQKVAGLAVPYFADWSAVDVAADGGGLRRLAVVHQSPEKVQLAKELVRRYPPDPDARGGIMHVFRTREPEIVPEVSDDMLVQGAKDEQHLRMMRQLGLRSYICVPLVISGQALGVLTFATAESGRTYARSDLALAEDLAHRAAVAIDNARLYAQLRHADRLKDEFLAMLAHELRNPLAPIRNALQVMKMPNATGDLVGQARDMAERQVQHMARLLDDLLDVSRISRGRIELRKEAVDVAAVVGRTVEAVRPLLEERRHHLTLALPPGPLRVEADPTRLEQVLTNLLNNAAKYTDPGGRIALTAEREEATVVVRVQDNGIGIAPDMLPRIFDLFVQAERRLDRSQGGIGIGLTLVKRLVELHGGSIAAYSAGPGRGSEFVVHLPALAEPAERAEGQPAGDLAGGLPRRRVLVVDDNVDAADSLALLLQLAGQDARAVYDGPQALALAGQWRPELVFLDIGMPGMDGYEVARRLRQQCAGAGMVVVALTGWGQDNDRRRSAEAGFDHHLVKPAEPAVLEKLLAGLLTPG